MLLNFDTNLSNVIESNSNPNNINICDISDLYLSQEILIHRIVYWRDKIQDTSINKKFDR